MRRYSEALKADVMRRMSPPQRQSVARISEETGIHICTLYAWRKGWRLEVEVVPASQKGPEGWSVADTFTVVMPPLPGKLTPLYPDHFSSRGLDVPRRCVNARLSIETTLRRDSAVAQESFPFLRLKCARAISLIASLINVFP